MSRSLIFAALALGACTPAQLAQINATTQTAIVDGQLFCAKATTAGPIVVAIINTLDAKAVTVTNKAASYVASVCATINAIPVSPPANIAAAPVVAVTVPAAS